MGARFFSGGGGVKLVDPIFNGQLFLTKKNHYKFLKKFKKIKKIVFF
jgi:hypothetical protein